MGRLTFLALLLAAFCLPGQADAAFVIDNFFSGSPPGDNDPGGSGPNFAVSNGVVIDPGGTLDDDAAGTLTVTATGTASANGAAGAFNFLAVSLGDMLTLTYALTSPIDLFSNGAFAASPLVLDLFSSVQGTFDLAVTYSGMAGSETANFVLNNTTPEQLAISGSNFSNGAVASSVSTIGLKFTRTSAGTGFATITDDTASISATPEPISFALLGVSCLAGFGGLSYRRRRQSTVVSG